MSCVTGDDLYCFQEAQLKYNEEDNLLIKVKDEGKRNTKGEENLEGRQYSFLVQIGRRRARQYTTHNDNNIIFEGSSCTGSMITEG